MRAGHVGASAEAKSQVLPIPLRRIVSRQDFKPCHSSMVIDAGDRPRGLELGTFF